MRDLYDFEESEIIEHLTSMGYDVTSRKSHLKDVFFYYSIGNVKEALFLLERVYPELRGISEKVKG